jgi:hypothetical protein
MSGVTAGSAALMFLLEKPAAPACGLYLCPATISFTKSITHLKMSPCISQVFQRCLESMQIDTTTTWRATGETNGALHPLKPMASPRWPFLIAILEQTPASGR